VADMTTVDETDPAQEPPPAVLQPETGRSVSTHLVSRGYQQNFASPDKRVTVLDAASGCLIDRGRPIKSNFVRPDFNAFVAETGELVELLEARFAEIEKVVLDQIRRVGPGACRPQQRAAIINLFAIHLVRSESFRTKHGGILDQLRAHDIPRYDEDERLQQEFIRQHQREPQLGEIANIGLAQLDAKDQSNEMFVQSMARNHNRLAEILTPFFVQVITIAAPRLPGFVLSDVPVVHANTTTRGYGFRDDLALGDADLIIGPLTRRTAVAFSAKPMPHARFTTRRNVELFNAALWRGALREVACHPDDCLATQQMFRRLDRLPTVHLLRR
jgi:hypothetical protein